jgi:phosphatidate cytidylyltransferase
MMKQRLIVSFGLLPAFIIIVWFGEPWFTILIALWGLIAAYEFFTLVKNIKVSPLTYFGLLWTLLFIISPYFKYDITLPSLLTSAVIFPLLLLLIRRNKEQAFNAWVWTLAGIIYIGWLLSYLISLSAFGNTPSITGPLEARNWVFLGFFATFVSDSSAYFIGRKWGKHHMAPGVSPKKTWEGAAAGVIGAVILSLLFTIPSPLQLPVAYFNYWQAIVLGIAISVFGQLGDLMKSLFKRNMGVKDSSKLLPGHGGFLDRMDSVAFAGVVVYYYLIWVNLIPLR